MKRIISIFMIISTLFSFTACSGNTITIDGESFVTETQTEQQSSDFEKESDSTISEPANSLQQNQQTSLTAQETEGTTPAPAPQETPAKALVVYFSCTGNTKAVAERISELTSADLYEIVPEIPYTAEDLNYNNNNCRANKEMNDASARPEIGSEAVDISAYDTIYIGYPIWWGTMPRIINTFLDTYDLSGKTVMPFCTSGSSGISKSVSDIRAEEPDADVRDGLRASNSSDSSIDEWLSRNDLL
ncbi:MAG: flavodoxin [Oscillospiraceae bacterium]